MILQRALLHFPITALCAALCLPVTSSRLLHGADTWSAFQNGGAVAVPAAAGPITWSADKGLAWQIKLVGFGQSSPVVHGDTIYVTSTTGEMKDHLHIEAIDLQSGQQRWRFDGKNSSPEKSSGYVSHAAPTPVCDDKGVIALFEGGNVIALGKDGQVRWQRDLVADFGAITARHGLGSSLEQDATRVFAWIERQEEPYLIAMSKETGETLWKVDGLGATTWSSPRLVPVSGGVHLVCSAKGKVVGLDPQTGQRLWEFAEITNNTSCTPMPVGEGAFLIGASDGRDEQSSSGGAGSNGLIRIVQQSDGTFKAEYAWRAKKASSNFGSPIIAGNKAYLVNRAGVLFQLDATTGEELSATRVASGPVWATPCVIGDYLYLFGQKGTTSVISLQDGQEVAQNELWSPEDETSNSELSTAVLYAAAPVPPYLILRRGDALYAIASPGTSH